MDIPTIVYTTILFGQLRFKLPSDVIQIVMSYATYSNEYVIMAIKNGDNESDTHYIHNFAECEGKYVKFNSINSNRTLRIQLIQAPLYLCKIKNCYS